jgi:predicted lipoprotein with Yx(FWY)xxD motif
LGRPADGCLSLRRHGLREGGRLYVRPFPVLGLVATFLISGLLSATAVGAPASRAVVKAAYNKTVKATILVDGSGRTLYLLTSDPKNQATCAQLAPICPPTWPALATTGKPMAGAGVDQSLLGTTLGAHGVTQVTYHGHALYYFHGGNGAGPGDKKPGDTRGQGFYSIWYVVSPRGTAIRK